MSRVQVGNFLYGIETRGHVKLFTAAAIGNLARYHGFKVERPVGSGIYPFPPRSRIPFHRYSPGIPNILLSKMKRAE